MLTPTRISPEKIERIADVIAGVSENGFRLGVNRNVKVNSPFVAGITVVFIGPRQCVRQIAESLDDVVAFADVDLMQINVILKFGKSRTRGLSGISFNAELR